MRVTGAGTGRRGPAVRSCPGSGAAGHRASSGLCVYGIEIPSSLKIKRLPACSNFLPFHYDRGWLQAASS